jgi:hypothetical protein
MSKSVKNGRRPEQDFCEVYIYIFVASYITWNVIWSWEDYSIWCFNGDLILQAFCNTAGMNGHITIHLKTPAGELEKPLFSWRSNAVDPENACRWEPYADRLTKQIGCTQTFTME